MAAWLMSEGTATLLVHSRDSHLTAEVRYTLEQFRMAEESALLVLVARLLSRLVELGGTGNADQGAGTMRNLINATCQELDEKAERLPNPRFLRSFVSACLGSFSSERSHIPLDVRLENIIAFSKQLLFQKDRLEQQQRAALSERQIDESVAHLERLALHWHPAGNIRPQRRAIRRSAGIRETLTHPRHRSRGSPPGMASGRRRASRCFGAIPLEILPTAPISSVKGRGNPAKR